METKIAITNKDKIKQCIKEVAKVIKNDGVVGFPTETVYVLGTNALKEECVKKYL
mgnify:CR=1 FL=1